MSCHARQAARGSQRHWQPLWIVDGLALEGSHLHDEEA